MKTALLPALTISCVSLCLARADLISQWDFNSPVSDNSVSTGVSVPSFGSGAASLIGGTTATFATGDAVVDPAASDNSGWNTTGYPTAAAGNLTAGVRFDVDTTGYENIQISWSQRHSSTASRYTRLQFTVNGTDFASDGVVLGGNGSFTNLLFDLGGLSGAANNPTFGFQIVTEFESTATGAGGDAYRATGDGVTYGTGGTIRFDMVTVSGSPIATVNTSPGISIVQDQTIRVGESTAALPFVVSDAQDAPGDLTMGSGSSDAAIIPDANIVLGGSGANRTVTVTAGMVPGIAKVILVVTDSGGRSTVTSFRVFVLALNTAPAIATADRTNALGGVPLTFPVTITDLESAPDALSLSGSSLNQDLVPDSNIVFGGSGSNRTATITPAAGSVGVTPIVLTVSDGALRSSATLGLAVTPTAATLFADPFGYADGSLITNSAYWKTRSGTIGEIQVAAGALTVSSKQSEDVVAPLAGGPYVTGAGTVLYAAFNLKAVELASGLTSGLIAHFADGSTLRGRVYVSTTNAAPGAFRVLVANGANNTVEFPTDLFLGTVYRIVTRYDLDTASTTLWVDPAEEAAAGVVATDSQAGARIVSYGFRQATEIGGTYELDDLWVGTSFAAVLDKPTAGSTRLEHVTTQGNLILTWNDLAFDLQTSATASGPFVTIPGATSPFSTNMNSSMMFYRLKRKLGSP